MDRLPRMCVDGTPIPLPGAYHADPIRPEPPAQEPCIYAFTRADLDPERPVDPEPTDEEIDAMAEAYATWKYGGKL